MREAQEGDANPVEEALHRATVDPSSETGRYLAATEFGGAVDDPHAVTEVVDEYHADGITFRRRDVGSSPSFRVTRADFEELVDKLREEAVPLHEVADHVELVEPAWDEDRGVYVVPGTLADEVVVGDVAFSEVELHVDDGGRAVGGTASLDDREDYDLSVELDVAEPDEVVRPDWAPADARLQRIAVDFEGDTVTFDYEQGVVNTNRLVLPANTVVQFHADGDHEYAESLGVPGLDLKLDLEPGERREHQLFVADEHVGTYDGESFMLTPEDITFETVVLPADEFDDWLDANT